MCSFQSDGGQQIPAIFETGRQTSELVNFANSTCVNTKICKEYCSWKLIGHDPRRYYGCEQADK